MNSFIGFLINITIFRSKLRGTSADFYIYIPNFSSTKNWKFLKTLYLNIIGSPFKINLSITLFISISLLLIDLVLVDKSPISLISILSWLLELELELELVLVLPVSVLVPVLLLVLVPVLILELIIVLLLKLALILVLVLVLN
jgi:hypothetical protein